MRRRCDWETQRHHKNVAPHPLMPTGNPGAERSCSTLRRKRKSAAGLPPVFSAMSPVASTMAEVSTSRRKFCLCRRRPESASTLRCRADGWNSEPIMYRVSEMFSQMGGCHRECPKFCVRGRVDHHAVTNLSSNMMANWVFASHHSRGGIFHSPATWRKTRYSSFIAASSVGKCPLVRTARRSFAFKDLWRWSCR